MEQEWISLNEFMRRNHIGYEVALRLINSGKVEYEKTEGGSYKIKVTKNEQIAKDMENLIRENEELKTTAKTALNILRQVVGER